ncbi:MAG: hypothetical protein GY765_07200 [bacterium]|nr:hypothetical protein [bacterium]
MYKKIVKVFLVALMICGAALAVSNILDVQLEGEMKLVHHHKDIPDCFGAGTNCIDMTDTTTTTNSGGGSN